MSTIAQRVRRAALAVASTLALSTALVVVAPLPASAEFGSTSCVGSPRNCVSLGDNAFHTWATEGVFGNQIPGIDGSFAAVMSYYDGATDLTTRRYTSSPTLDVLVTDYNYGFNNILGWVECLPGSATSGSHPYRRCDRQKLRLNGSYASLITTWQARRSLSCHEIGHTVGLRHTTRSGSCMETPFDPSDVEVYLNGYDKADINRYH